MATFGVGVSNSFSLLGDDAPRTPKGASKKVATNQGTDKPGKDAASSRVGGANKSRESKTGVRGGRAASNQRGGRGGKDHSTRGGKQEHAAAVRPGKREFDRKSANSFPKDKDNRKDGAGKFNTGKMVDPIAVADVERELHQRKPRADKSEDGKDAATDAAATDAAAAEEKKEEKVLTFKDFQKTLKSKKPKDATAAKPRAVRDDGNWEATEPLRKQVKPVIVLTPPKKKSASPKKKAVSPKKKSASPKKAASPKRIVPDIRFNQSRRPRGGPRERGQSGDFSRRGGRSNSSIKLDDEKAFPKLG